MRIRITHFFLMAMAFAVSVNCPSAARAKTMKWTTTNFVVTYEDIDTEQAKKFAIDAEKDFSVITSYLSRRPTRSIHVRISDQYVFPRYSQKEGEIFVPADRIRKISNAVQKHRGIGLLLVMTPIIAPSTNVRWGDFMETGLRVFLQEKFGAAAERSFPMLGRDLHDATGNLASNYGKFIPLAEVERARTWRSRPTRTRQLAYLEAGSFVRFLIEELGLEKFMKWYDGRRFEDVYSRTMPAMEQQWKHYLGTQPR